MVLLSGSCLDGTGMRKQDPEWEAERNPCRNVALQRKEEKLLFEAPSDVAGTLIAAQREKQLHFNDLNRMHN